MQVSHVTPKDNFGAETSYNRVRCKWVACHRYKEMGKLFCTAVCTQDGRVSFVIGPIPPSACITAKDGEDGRQADTRWIVG
jgi:hypothetical protein